METKKVSKSKKVSPKKKANIKLIRERAQEIYLKRMEEGTPGNAESDWLQAEEELSN